VEEQAEVYLALQTQVVFLVVLAVELSETLTHHLQALALHLPQGKEIKVVHMVEQQTKVRAVEELVQLVVTPVAGQETAEQV
jgi:hypothetical protein